MSNNYLIFDLDNTLTDYNSTNRYAMSKVFKQLNLKMTEKDYQDYLKFEIEYWSRFENSNQSIETYGMDRIDYVRSRIYQEYFKRRIISLKEAYVLMNIYINNLGVVNNVYDGVEETLDYLYTKYNLYIASNGPQVAQIRKLINTNLYQYFKGVLSSEIVGYSKPKKEFFDYLIKEYSIDPTRASFVGDSLTTDILGANNSNLYSIWYNRLHVENTTNIKPDVEINNIKELKKIL